MPKPRIGGNLFPSGGEGSGNAVRAILEGGRAMAAGVTAAGEGVSRGIINKKNYERGKAEAEKDRAFREGEAEKGRAFTAAENERDRQIRLGLEALRGEREHAKDMAALAIKNQKERDAWDTIGRQLEQNGGDPSQAYAERDKLNRTAGAFMEQVVGAGIAGAEVLSQGYQLGSPESIADIKFRREMAKTGVREYTALKSDIRKAPVTNEDSKRKRDVAEKKVNDGIAALNHRISMLDAQEASFSQIAEERANWLKQQAGVKRVMGVLKPRLDMMEKNKRLSPEGRAAVEESARNGGTPEQAMRAGLEVEMRGGTMTADQYRAVMDAMSEQDPKKREQMWDKAVEAGVDPGKVISLESSVRREAGIESRDKARTARQQATAERIQAKTEQERLDKIGASIEKTMLKPSKPGKEKEFRDPVATAQRLLPTQHPDDTMEYLMSGRATPQIRTALMYLLRMQISEQYSMQGLSGEELLDKVEADFEEISGLIESVYAKGGGGSRGR